MSERYADGSATPSQLTRAGERADAAFQGIHLSGGGDADQNPAQAVLALGLDLEIHEAVEFCAATLGAAARGEAYERIWQAPGKDHQARWAEDDAVRRAAEAEEERAQAKLLRDIFGPLPFRPAALDSSLRKWNDGTVVRIAQGIYDERAFDRLPVLADALLDAGCDKEDMLAHCREQGGIHARGCWVLDLLLGKA
jgi:hypothetical protein